MRTNNFIACLWISCLLTAPACNKFLDKPSNSSLGTPQTVADFQGIMDESTINNYVTPGLGPIMADDYRVIPAMQKGLDSPSVAAYTWQPSYFQNYTDLSWSHPYDAIYDCNVVLDNLPVLHNLDSADKAAQRFVLGQAYFIRAFMYYHLEETFGQPYRPGSASTDLGVPLRTSDDPMVHVTRATVQSTYQQIVSDLGQAVSLLPAAVQFANRNRPCRPAAYALLSRVCLTQQNFALAKAYADSSLMLYDSLVDYNTVDSSSLHPFAQAGNAEVMFQCSAYNYPLQYRTTTTVVDSALYSSYVTDDLRRVVFFQASPAGHYFKGQYTGLFYLFAGMAVDEVYLLRAESNARMGNVSSALADLNTLLSKRWRRGRFQPLTAGSSAEVLQLVITQRRMETLFREGRWYDLRRYNQYAGFTETLTRSYLSGTYILPPNDSRYALPIPQREIDQDGIQQNPE